MSTALLPLQTAVITALRADPAVTALVTGVWDGVPEHAAHPYVSLGSITELADDAHNQRGLAATVVWHIWSTHLGWTEAAEILAALDAVLDRRPLAVAGWRDVSIAHEQHQQLRDPDPTIRHINVSYRVWLTREDEE